MKVYVDTSKLESHDIQSITDLSGKEFKQVRMWFETDEEIEVVSLADYTKQVRKEVLNQVYKVFTTEGMWRELKDWWLQSGNCKELKDCLDAIVEETSVENIVKRFGHDSKLYQLLDQIQGETK